MATLQLLEHTLHASPQELRITVDESHSAGLSVRLGQVHNLRRAGSTDLHPPGLSLPLTPSFLLMLDGSFHLSYHKLE